MNRCWVILSMAVICACNADQEPQPRDPVPIEESLIPGSRTPNGGLVLSNRLMLDRDMNFAYLRLNELDFAEFSKPEANLSDLGVLFETKIQTYLDAGLKDDFDFVALLITGYTSFPPFFRRWSNEVQGIGCNYNTSLSRKLKGTVFLPGDPTIGGNVTLHEIAHYWGNCGVIPSTEGSHWGFSSAGGYLGGFDSVTYLGDRKYQGWIRGNPGFHPVINNHGFGNLELYLMGLIPAAELLPVTVAENPEIIDEETGASGIFIADTLTTISPVQFIDTWGERLPSVENSQKHFKLLVVVVSDQHLLDIDIPNDQKNRLDQSIVDFAAMGDPGQADTFPTKSFWKVTGGRATLEIRITPESLKLSEE